MDQQFKVLVTPTQTHRSCLDLTSYTLSRHSVTAALPHHADLVTYFLARDIDLLEPNSHHTTVPQDHHACIKFVTLASICHAEKHTVKAPIIIIPITSCARGDTICLRPLQVDNIFAFIRQVAPVPACWLFKTSATSSPLTF